MGWLVGWLVVRHSCGGQPPPPPGESSRRTYAASMGMGGALRRGRPPAHSLPTLFPRPLAAYPLYPLPLTLCPVPSPVPVLSLLVTPSHHHRT